MKNLKQITLLTLVLGASNVQAGVIPSDITPLESLGFCASFFQAAAKDEPSDKVKQITKIFLDMYVDEVTTTYPKTEDTKRHIEGVKRIVKREVSYIKSITKDITDEKAKYNFNYDYGYQLGTECIETHSPKVTKPNEYDL